jgi:hypothetical protein
LSVQPTQAASFATAAGADDRARPRVIERASSMDRCALRRIRDYAMREISELRCDASDAKLDAMKEPF